MAKPDLCNRPSLSLFLFGACNCCTRPVCWREKAQHLETAGHQKVEMVVAGSEPEGLYRILRGALSHSSISMVQPPTKRHCQIPTATISKPPPQEPEEVKPESSAPIAEGVYWHRRLPPWQSLRPWRLPSPPTWHPFIWMWGHQKDL